MRSRTAHAEIRGWIALDNGVRQSRRVEEDFLLIVVNPDSVKDMEEGP